MISLLTGGSIYAPSAAAVNYRSIQGTHAFKTTTLGAYQVVPCDGVFSHLAVSTRGTPGAGKSFTVALFKEGSATALTVTVGDGDALIGAVAGKADTVNSVAVVAGDLVCMIHTPTGTPTMFETAWCMKFTATTRGESIVLGCNESGTTGRVSTTTTEDGQVCAGGNRPGAGLFVDEVIPTDGAFTAFYVDLETAPDPGLADGYVFTIQVNGVDSAAEVTITGDDLTGSWTGTVDLVPGDIVILKTAPTGTPAGLPHPRWGLVWLPDTIGESIVLGCTADLAHATNTEYTAPNGWTYGLWSNTISIAKAQPFFAGTIKRYYAKLQTAPGAGKNRAFTIRKFTDAATSSDAANTLTISDGDTEGDDVVNEESVAEYNLLHMGNNPNGTPPTGGAGWGFVFLLDDAQPTAAGGGNVAHSLVKAAYI